MAKHLSTPWKLHDGQEPDEFFSRFLEIEDDRQQIVALILVEDDDKGPTKTEWFIGQLVAITPDMYDYIVEKVKEGDQGAAEILAKLEREG